MNLLNLLGSKVTAENQLSSLYRSFLKVALKSRSRFIIGKTLEVFASLLPTIIIILYALATYYVATVSPKIVGPSFMHFTLFPAISFFFIKFIFTVSDFLSRLGKRLRAVDSETVLARDPRAGIVYLRSFMEEVITGSTYMGLREEPDTSRSDEQLIYEVASEVGPMIAVGQPGEILPPLGAARLYLDPNGDWQSTVKDHLAQAQFVIISPEYTPGVLWEIVTVFDYCPPEKIIISLLAFNRRGESSYNHLRTLVLEAAGKSGVNINLPEDTGKSSFIYFDSDGTPKLSDSLEQIFLKKGLLLNLNKLKRRQQLSGAAAFTTEASRLLFMFCAILIPMIYYFLARFG